MIRISPSIRRASAWCAAVMLALLPATAGAQGFQAVTSKNGFDVWAVGDGGMTSRSFDGGISWTNAQLTTARPLRGIVHRGVVVMAVADSGQVYRSTDNGVSWTRTVLPGAPDLKAIEMPSPSVAVIVGAGGLIRRSDDAGVNWATQDVPGGTLFGLRMVSDLEGWAAGAGGRVLHSTDGTTWNPVATGVTNDLLAIDAAGSRVWVVGTLSLALRSTTGGSSWTPLNLRMELPGDVRSVTLSGVNGVVLTGGGGFIRRSADDGATWGFDKHPLISAGTDYFAYDANKAWVTGGTTRAVGRTINGGASWSLASGTTTSWSWVLKRSAGAVTIRGNTFSTSPLNRNSVWAVMGATVYKSFDRGETWSILNTIPSVGKTNSFYVCPTDTTKWIAAVGTPDRIVVSTNSGASWTTTLSRDFSEYGMPLELNPDNPNMLVFGPEDGRVYRTQNWGATWDTLSNPGFRSPCDIVISPDNNANIVVGDGVTGFGQADIFQSENSGVAWSDRYTSESSETPCLWSSRLGNTVMFATNWSSGGVWRSLDSGKTWLQVTTVTSAWGGGTATDDPNLVVYNRYAGSPNYVSTDGGTTYASSALSNPGSGYAIQVLDRSTILDMHSNGIYKLNVTYGVPAAGPQALALVSPDGGESWAAGSVQAVSWTATNLAMVVIEWRAGPSDPWQFVAQAEGSAGNYFWTVPAVPTTTAQVRVRDLADSSPVDQSTNVFTILAPQIAVSGLSLDYGTHPVGSATLDSVRVTNTGTAPLNLTSITTGTAAFHPGRSSFVLGAGASDTVGVTFTPPAEGAFEDTLVLANNAGAPIRVPLSGIGGQSTHVLSLTVPDGGEVWQYGQTHDIVWTSGLVGSVAIDYRIGELDPWIPLVASTPAAPGSWPWVIPANPTANARVRVREVGGGLIDQSSNVFVLTVSQFQATPEPLDFGPTPINYSTWDVLEIENKGNGPLNVTSVISDNPHFVVTRTSFVISSGDSDTLAVWFTPTSAGEDSALITFVANDPTSPHPVKVRGAGQTAVDVGDLPLAFALEMPRPNPFSRETSITYALPEPADVTLEVFDLGGRRVASLAHGRMPAGRHITVFRPGTDAGLSSGVYFVRLKAGAFSRTQKILHLGQ